MASVKNSDLKKYIFGILKDADLSTLSSKMVRKRCEEKFKTDLSARKKEVDDIVMTFVDNANSDKNDSSSSDQDENSDSDGEKSGSSSNNESSENSASDADSGSESDKAETLPKAKKQKKEINSNTNGKKNIPVKSNSNQKEAKLGDDAALARQLQEEEWNLRSRSTRRAITKRHKTKDENQKTPKIRKGTSTYKKKCYLSPELAEIMESSEMARPDIVKKMWSIVRERELFDPSNKQFVFCDEQLIKVFGQKRIKMFSMMKYLRNHIKDKE